MIGISPDRTDTVEHDGVRVTFDVYERDAPTLVLLPTWVIVDSRAWKAQIRFLARQWRLIVVDGRGCGRSDRPHGPHHYTDDCYVDDLIAILDRTDTASAVLVALSRGAKWAALLAADHPERVDGIVFIAPGVNFDAHPEMTPERFSADVDDPEGWDTFNAANWLRDWRSWAEFFSARLLDAPYSRKAYDDAVEWCMDADPQVIVDTMRSRLVHDVDWVATVDRIECPTLVLHGVDDAVNPHRWGAHLAERTNGQLVTYDTKAHGLQARWPVDVNRRIHDFATRVTARVEPSTPIRVRPLRTTRRVLYLSSPIGLGHVRRDLAIARSLRRLQPDIEIDWLAQDPVTRVLRDADERVHTGSAWLTSESAHLAAEADGHCLHAMTAFRNMDELFVGNFHVFQEAAEQGRYDLVVADEAWDVDHFWHEHPDLKRAPLAWLTDFVGFLPVGGSHDEVEVAADLNAEMIEHVARHGWVRDRSVFVGESHDVVPDAFGPGMAPIRSWVERNYEFAGYITGFDPVAPDERDDARRELGYDPERPLVIVTVGGSGVGHALLRRLAEIQPALADRVPGVHTLLVTGPRIDPASFPDSDGLSVRPYVPDLHRHLEVCDLAVVQGGLTTTMELAATGRPFIYLPLEGHFEQQIHVPHRLERYGAGVRLEFRDATPDRLLDLITTTIGTTTQYRPVEPGGADRAARLIAELL